MGIAFISTKAKRFKQQTEALFEEKIASENIFSGLPENVIPTFRCRSLTSDLPEVGVRVLIRDTGSTVDVLLMNVRIGFVMPQDASELRDYLNRINSIIVAAQVTESQPISNIFLVQLKTH